MDKYATARRRLNCCIRDIGRVLKLAGVVVGIRPARNDEGENWMECFKHRWAYKFFHKGRFLTTFEATNLGSAPNAAWIVWVVLGGWLRPNEAGDPRWEADFHHLNQRDGRKGERFRRLFGDELFQALVDVFERWCPEPEEDE